MEEIKIIQNGALECDFDGIKARLNEQLELYSKLVFTEETKKDAKETVAQLRKEKKSFQDAIKDIKKEYMKPFDEFFAQASEISDLYDKPICFIAEQIEAFEAQRIEAKKAEIRAIYAELVPEEEWQNIIPLARIYSSKWENATCTAKQIKDEIMAYKESAKSAIQMIKAMESDKEEDAIKLYKQNLDATACIQYIQAYEKQKKEIMAREEQRLKEEAEARIRAEERAKIEAEQQKALEIKKAKEEAVSMLIPEDEGEEALEYSYLLTMTVSAKEKLELYMNSIGISFEELKF